MFGIHKNTVRAWIKQGLPTTDDKRKPILILGIELSKYLQAKRLKNKRTCKPGEIYCVKCHEPRMPAGSMADYEIVTDTLGNLIGICPNCNIIIYRRVNLGKLSLVCGKLVITMPKALQHLNESIHPFVNSDLKQEY